MTEIPQVLGVSIRRQSAAEPGFVRYSRMETDWMAMLVRSPNGGGCSEYQCHRYKGITPV